MISKAKFWFVFFLFFSVTVTVLLPFSPAFSQTEDYSLTPAGHIGGQTTCSAVQGNYAYLGQGGYLTVLDITGAEFRQVASLLLNGEGIDFSVSGSYLYCYVNHDSGFQVVNISDPLNPVVVGSANVPGHRRGALTVAGDYAYIATVANGLQIVNISNPANPQVVGHYTPATEVIDVAVSNNYAFVLDGNMEKMHIVNISDPTNPALEKEFAVKLPQAIAIQGNYAYVAVDSYPKIGLQIIDISNPVNPALAGYSDSKVVENNVTVSKSPKKVAVQGTHAYLRCVGSIYVFSYDVSNPANPINLDAIKLEGSWDIGSFQVVNSTAYLTSTFTTYGFQTVDISDPANLTAGKTFGGPWDVTDVYYLGDTLLVSGSEKLWIYDAADPASPILRHVYPDWAGLMEVSLVHTVLFGIKDDEVVFLDFSDISNITQLNSYKPGSGVPREMIVDENYLYLLVDDGTDRLELIDISNINSPNKIGSHDLPGEARNLFVLEDRSHVFVLYYNNDTDQGFQLLNISNPANPTLVSTTQTTGLPMTITVLDSMAFVGSNQGTEPNVTWTLEKFDMTNLNAPAKVGEVGGSGAIWDIKIFEDVLLAGVHGQSVLLIFPGGGMTIEKRCPSPGTTRITTSPPTATTPGGSATGTVASREGYGDHKNKDTTGDVGVPIQIIKVPKKEKGHISITQQLVAPLPPNYIGNYLPPHSCLTQPSGEIQCQPGKMVQIAAIDKAPYCEGYGWNFYEWQGCATGNSKTTTVQCQAGCVAVAVWHLPLLGVHGIPAKRQHCFSETKEDVIILNFSIGASALDDWEVNSLSFVVNGSEEYKQEIQSVLLYHSGTKVGEQNYPGHGSSVTFAYPFTVKANKTEKFYVAYKFNPEFAKCVQCDDPSSEDCPDYYEYTMSLSNLQLVGNPKSYANGRVIGSAESGPLQMGCILNVTEELFSKTIQDAVDLASEGDSIQVCPGEYEENIVVDMKLTIKSLKGAAETTIKAKDAGKPVFHLKANEIKIDGFTIKNSNFAGIYINETSSSMMESGSQTGATSIDGMRGKGNNLNSGAGNLTMPTAQSGISGCQILSNRITGNTNGILLKSAMRTEIRDNVITGNWESGIKLSTDKVGNNNVFGNFIGVTRGGTPQGNKDGVTIADGASFNNIGSEKEGDSNIISGNTENGISIYGEKTIFNSVMGNFIGTDKNCTKKLPNKVGVFIWGKATSNSVGGLLTGSGRERNIISGNNDCGVLIKGVGTFSNAIYNNLIGIDNKPSQNTLLPNKIGIRISGGASDNTIGSDVFLQGNTIAGNLECGVKIEGSGTKGNKVWGNFIGADHNSTPLPNKNGIIIENGAQGNFIGGKEQGKGNLISGNTEYGIIIQDAGTDSNKVAGNNIGTKYAGDEKLPNKYGILIRYTAKANRIGEWNTISGNTEAGIIIKGLYTEKNNIFGNQIGTNKEGMEKVPNRYGIYIDGASSNIIGGWKDEKERNIISGNTAAGVVLTGKYALSNLICGNYIGTMKDGSKELPNKVGIQIEDAAGANVVGVDADKGKRNIISGNTDVGVKIEGNDTKLNRVCGNYIGTNREGRDKIPNHDGVAIGRGATENYVGGGYRDEERNIISGNVGSGVIISGKSTENNIIWGNYIGTDKDGTGPIPNGRGVRINNSAATNYIGVRKQEGKGNIISGNSYHGIEIESNGNIISGNYIGTDKTGMTALPNSMYGILIEDGSRNTIGGETTNERNIISGNTLGGVLITGYSGVSNLIVGNFIGTDVGGAQGIRNGVGIKLIETDQNFIGGVTTGEGNVISGNDMGILLIKSSKNRIRGNYVGTDRTGLKKLPNSEYGILLSWSFKNIIGEQFSLNSANIISGNDSSGIKLYLSKGNKIIKNYIGTDKSQSAEIGNHTGIQINSSWDNTVYSNIIKNNCIGIVGNKTANKISHNVISNSRCPSSGIHLSDSRSKITGNLITGDAGSAILCENSSAPTIHKNNIYDNAGFGLKNLDSLVTINAQDNWWGDASGPESGHGVSGNVDFSNWRTAQVVLVTSASRDTLLIPAGARDSLLLAVQNWQNPNDIVNIRLQPDSVGWLQGSLQYTLAMKDSMGADTSLYCTVPANAQVGDFCKVKITATSQTDPTVTDRDSFYVFVYNPMLASIVVSPDSAVLSPGQTRQFSALGVDSLGQSMTIQVNWSATGGTIDSSGLYTAGRDTGTFVIVAEEMATHLRDSARVRIQTGLARIVVSPDTVLLRAGQTQQFMAQGFDTFGDSMHVELLWQATGGSVDSTGLYTAGPDTGMFIITAKDTASPIVGKAVAFVFPALTKVLITPDSVTLAPAETQQFEVQGYDSLGTEVQVFARWLATGGTVDSAGFYTAGPDTGLYPVTATDTLVHLSGQALVFIKLVSSIRESAVIPDNFCLYQNYPNPFNPETTIRFDVKEQTNVLLQIYDVLGREVLELVNSVHPPGSYKVVFDAADLPSGLYLCKIKMGDFQDMKKMLLLK